MRTLFFVLVLLLTAAWWTVAHGEEVARIETKGLIVKDYLTVEAMDDVDMGVTCYVTLAFRSMSFDDPSDTALSCVRVGESKLAVSAKKDVFKASKSVFFKRFHIDRVYDARRGMLVYVAYTTDTDGANAAHAMSAVLAK